MSLEELIDNPAVTTEQILDVIEDGHDLFAAAAVVFARVERAAEAAQKALALSEAMLARPPLPDYDTRGRRMRSAEIDFALQRAEEGQAATWAAWERYQPWKQALDCLDEAMNIVRIIESN